MLRIIVFTAAVTFLVFTSCARAEDEFVASLRLRGGYDTNPQLSSGQGPVGSAFVATDLALAAAGKDDDSSWGVAAEASGTRYASPLLVPSTNGKVILRGSMGNDDLRISTTTTIADVNTYNLRSTDLVQAVKLESLEDNIKLFVTAEGARSNLNQTNAIFQDFLPTPLQYWSGTIIPGASVIRGKAEIGVSVNLSARRYTEELDTFGYRRDNERIQPFVFARYESDDVTAFASVSQLYGRWHDVDFSNVDRTLYDASFSWRPKPFSLELTAARRAGETSFPISPITIDTVYSAKAGWQVDPKLLLTAAVGYGTVEYLDSPFRAQTLTMGVGVSRDIGHDMKLGFDVSRVTGTLLNGERAEGVVVASSLTKRFAPGEVKEKDKAEAAKPPK
jgi:hypothetical protein